MTQSGSQIDLLAIGAILKAQREKMGLKQADIGRALQIKSYNFVSMMEKGRSQIPLAKIEDIVIAYQFEKEINADYVMLTFVRWLYPEIWDMSRKLARIALESNQTLDEVHTKMRDDLSYILERYELHDFARMVDAGRD
jgi:transcriptional regulator with XRE-family HTH domain